MAVIFDAVDDVIDCGSAASLDQLGPLTFSMWINPISEGEGAQAMFVCKISVAGAGLAFRFSAGTNSLRFVKGGTTNLLVVGTDNEITLNTWQHILATWDGSTTATNVHMYINGTEITYTTQQNGAVLLSDALNNFQIGGNPAGDRTFDGSIEEVAVFNRVVSAAEIALLAKSRLKGMPLMLNSASSLVGYWPMDDFAHGATVSGASSVLDRSGTGNHGTPSGSPVAQAGSILSYPGLESYVDAQDAVVGGAMQSRLMMMGVG